MRVVISPQQRRAALVALAAVIALFCWQTLTVHYNYRGNWTALFCISPAVPVPEFLKSEQLYIFPNGGGYDGMIYHLIAHDPWMRKGSAQALGAVSYRYQRILLPALAWMLAFGQDRWVHPAYFTVILAFAFLGVYWSSLFVPRIGLNPAWGLLFAVTPAVIISIDRMTVDIALAAFTAAFALYATDSPGGRMFAILLCAALTRETALPLIAGYAAYLLTRKNWRGASLASAAATPAIAWFFYLHLSHREPSEFQRFLSWPLAAFLSHIVHPAAYDVPPIAQLGAQVMDVAALGGIALALLQVVQLLLGPRWNARSAAIYALALMTIFLGSRAGWSGAFDFGRVLTPLLLLTAFERATTSPLTAFLPILLVDARISLNFVSQIAGVFRGLSR